MRRLLCTPDDPCTTERQAANPGARWEHQEAHEIGEQEECHLGGDLAQWRCDSCGITWTTELPQ